jgi:hypothetical protein
MVGEHNAKIKTSRNMIAKIMFVDIAHPRLPIHFNQKAPELESFGA